MHFKPLSISLYVNDLFDMFDDACDPVELRNRQISCLPYSDEIVTKG